MRGQHRAIRTTIWRIAKRHSRIAIASALTLALAGAPAVAADTTVRFATFNASLNRDLSGQLLGDLANPLSTGLTGAEASRSKQVHNVAEIVQRLNADVLLINEFDFDLAGMPPASIQAMALGYSSQAAQRFQDNFLAVSHGNAVRGFTNGLACAHRYRPNTNTGLASGFALNNNGVVAGGDDAWGFGNFGGQFGFTVYSEHEIVAVRSFQNFKWKDMSGNLLTNDPVAGANNLANFYSAEEIANMRLSSKNHVDVTVRINGQDVHFLTAHPTRDTGRDHSSSLRDGQSHQRVAGYVFTR